MNRVPPHHEKVINAGFSAIGNNKWLAVTVAMGKMATKSFIIQSCGTKLLPTANMIIPAIPSRANIMLHLNFFNTLGTSMKKLENSASLAVAPHVMFISNMWARRAEETCRERPPRKMASMGIHLQFSRTEEYSLALTDIHEGQWSYKNKKKAAR
jgi:hypothetical protein